MRRGRLFDLSEEIARDDERVDVLTGGAVRIERIVSRGQASPEGFWYDQDEDEWVVLLAGEAALAFDDGSEVELAVGDWLLLPAHRRHRVARTSAEPPCVWLAIHGRLGP